MRIGVVSDLHCNAPGLARALELMGDIDHLFCLGDSIYEFRFSNDVVRELRRLDAHVIQGNHEEVFFGFSGERARAAPDIDADLAGWLSAQPLRKRVVLDGVDFHLCHSTPWEPRGAYIIPENRELDRFADTDAHVVLYGHTHRQVVRQVRDVLIVNPGSTGDGRDAANDRQLSCAVIDTQPLEARIIDFADPS